LEKSEKRKKDDLIKTEFEPPNQDVCCFKNEGASSTKRARDSGGT
jgi:hypothetical protein